MEESVADSVSESWLTNHMMPLLGWALAGDHGRGLSVAILDDLQEVLAFGIG